MRKSSKIIVWLITGIGIVVVLAFAFLFYCMVPGRSAMEFQRYVVDKECAWKAEEVDCTLYTREMSFYEDIKGKYDIDEEYENEDDLLGVMTLGGEEIAVMFRYGGPGNTADLAEVYYDLEQKSFEQYEDMKVGFYYKINFLKNKLSIKIDEECNLLKDNKIAKYLKDNNINEITFVKSNEKNDKTYEGAIAEETDTTLNTRYEKAFGVNVLSAKYNKKKKQMEIVIKNNKDYDIEYVNLCIAMKGKTAYDLGHRWKYEEILPYQQSGYLVDYYYDGIIEAKSEKEIIISGIDDNQIAGIKAMVNFYGVEGEIFQSPAWSSFNNLTDEECYNFIVEERK